MSFTFRGAGLPSEADVLFVDRSGKVVLHEVKRTTHTLGVNVAQSADRDYLGELSSFRDQDEASMAAYVAIAEPDAFWVEMFGGANPLGAQLRERTVGVVIGGDVIEPADLRKLQNAADAAYDRYLSKGGSKSKSDFLREELGALNASQLAVVR